MENLIFDPVFWVDFLALTNVLFFALWLTEKGTKKK